VQPLEPSNVLIGTVAAPLHEVAASDFTTWYAVDDGLIDALPNTSATVSGFGSTFRLSIDAVLNVGAVSNV
jgi:hypothetical protein